MGKTLLIAGFGRFPGAAFNPSATLALRLARQRRPAFANLERVAHVFATSYAAVDRDLPKLIAKHRPDAILMFGLATRRKRMCIEMAARNAASVLFPDADGFLPRAAAIRPRAQARLAGRAPFQRLLMAARAARVPVALSRDAGRYLCNYLYWRALELSGKIGGARLVVLVHVPQVRAAARRRRSKPVHTPTLADLLRAGEAISLAAISAANQGADS